MKRGLAATILCVAVWLGSAGTASAQDRAGKLGIGFDQTIAGASGIQARYWVIPKLSLEAVIGYDQTSADNFSDSSLNFAILGLYSIMYAEGFELNVGGGFDIIRTSAEVGGVEDSNTGVAIELGIGPTWWVTEKFALNLLFGLLIDTGNGTEINLFADSEVVGSAGFIWQIN